MRVYGLIKTKVRNGFGTVATKDFLEGDKILKFNGKVLPIKEAEELPDPEKSNTIRLSKITYLSPRGDCIFVNHSCRPNSRIWKHKGELYLSALQDIKSGEEITFDYSTVLADDDFWTMNCNCGERNCRKIIKQFRLLPKALKIKYRRQKVVPDYIDSAN